MPSITRNLLVATALAGGLGPLPVAAFDAASYHESHCTRCHGTAVYTRDDRRVRSLPALEAQVARCDANLATGLFPEDLGQLVDYLNDSFYKFQK